MKAMVTGATGFIGSKLIGLLLNRGWKVNAFVRSGSHSVLDHPSVTVFHGTLDDVDSIRLAMVGCDAVFHTAALTGFWSKDSGEYYQTNVLGTRNILNQAKASRISRVVHTSTWATIGNPSRPRTVVTEETQTELKDIPGHYRTSKFLAEQEVKSAVMDGLDVVMVNPTVPIGAGDQRPTPSGGIILDFLRGRLPAFVDTHLNLIDVDTVALGHLLAWEKGQTGNRYLLGNWNIKLEHLLRMLSEITGINPPILKLPISLLLGLAVLDDLVESKLLRRKPFIPLEGLLHARSHSEVDCSKAIKELGLPITPIQPALKQAIAWFKNNGYLTH